MLVADNDSNFPYPVGLAVAQWEIDAELRTYIVYPIQKDNVSYVEVDIATEPEHVLTVKPATKSWQSLGEDFGDKSEGYPSDEETVQDLYDVWDDGAAKHPETAERLYEKYKPLIDAYAEDATHFLDRQAAHEYDQKIQEAKNKGWDTSLIEKSEPGPFPYRV